MEVQIVIFPVSYTHLDVYKRQGLQRTFLPDQSGRLQRGGTVDDTDALQFFADFFADGFYFDQGELSQTDVYLAARSGLAVFCAGQCQLYRVALFWGFFGAASLSLIHI